MSRAGGTGGYEKSDVKTRTVVLFAVWLSAGILASLLLMHGLLATLEARGQAAARKVLSAPRVAAGALRPPEPVLQGAPGSRFPLKDPVHEMEALRGEQRDRLNHGAIPIEEAKKRLLERGLPVRQESRP